MTNFKNLNRKITYWVSILLAQFFLFYFLSNTSFGVRLANTIFELKKKIHQTIFSISNFSIGDLFYISLFIYLVVIIYKILRKKTRHRYIIKLLKIVNILYFIYQIFWGLLYFQSPIIEKLPTKKISEETLSKLTLKYIHKTNTTRNYVSQDKNGIFYLKNLEETKNEILENQRKIPRKYSNKRYLLIDNFKPTLFGKYFSYTGILGYYNPFTSEAQYNPRLPATYIPFTLAHESAHQLGFAREQEANFIAYLICKNSNNPELEYSANLYVLKSLLNAQLEKNPEFVGQAKLFLSDAVKRDLEYNKIFYEQHQGWINNLFYATNDLFLKSNRQEGSITYSYFIELLVRYEN